MLFSSLFGHLLSLIDLLHAELEEENTTWILNGNICKYKPLVRDIK